MKIEFDNTTPEDLARRRVNEIYLAVNRANEVIDDYFSKSAPVEINEYSAREDLDHAHKKSTEAINRFAKLSDNTLGQNEQPIPTNATHTVYDINHLNGLRRDVSSAYEQKPAVFDKGIIDYPADTSKNNPYNQFVIPEDKAA